MSIIEARKQWARSIVEAAPRPLPAYGSTDWLQLPANDSRKIAACVVAAECWSHDGDTMAERLRVELEEHRAAEARLDAAQWQAAAKRLAAHARFKSSAERKQALIDAAKPRPGDFEGIGGDGQ